MDKKPADGHRTHFLTVVAQTPVLLAMPGTRHMVLIYNEGPGDIRVGPSGTQGVLLDANQSLQDTYTIDDWWAYAPSSSGTVSGYVVL